MTTHSLRSSINELNGALKFVLQRRLLTWSLATHLSLNILWSIAFFIGAPILVSQSLGNNIGAYGLIVGAFGISGVISTLIIGSISIRRHALKSVLPDSRKVNLERTARANWSRPHEII